MGFGTDMSKLKSLIVDLFRVDWIFQNLTPFLRGRYFLKNIDRTLWIAPRSRLTVTPPSLNSKFVLVLNLGNSGRFVLHLCWHVQVLFFIPPLHAPPPLKHPLLRVVLVTSRIVSPRPSQSRGWNPTSPLTFSSHISSYLGPGGPFSQPMVLLYKL